MPADPTLSTSNPRPSRLARSGPALVAVAALLLVLMTGHRGLFGLRLAEAPGLTLDEGFNTATGVYLARALAQHGLGLLHPATVREIYGSPTYNPDHPPLGRWALGLVHEWLDDSDAPFNEMSARPASAIGFALTVLLAGMFLQKWYGPVAGTVAAVAVAILPRQFGHAHLASLETFIGLTYAACIFITAERCRPGGRSSGYGPFALAGVFFGLALLTKIQGVFLGPAVGLWAWSQWGPKRAIPRVVVFGVVGLLVFVVGWPWLWLDPVTHLKEYFARTTERQTLYCYYWGERWEDRAVPWHYPWVIFAVTVPVGLHLLAARGIFWRPIGREGEAPAEPQTLPSSNRETASRRSQPADSSASGSTRHIDSRIQLLLWAIAIPLVVFTLPGIRVYDGERLFGIVFPLWAALAGAGAAAAAHRFSSRAVLVALASFIGAQAWGTVALNPFQLSYYNAFTAGLGGADRLGFERSYWMEGLTDSFQREIVAHLPRGSRLDIAPVLHARYLPHLEMVSPILQSAGITLAPYDDKRPGGSKFVLKFYRKADPWQSLEPPPDGTEILAETKRSGVPLVTLYRLP